MRDLNNQHAAELLEKLIENRILTKAEFTALIRSRAGIDRQRLYEIAVNLRQKHYGKDVYLRGLIEYSNYCRNDCRYCGIRAGNRKAERYRLTPEQILECCRLGYEIGYRTFVLQGGEDPGFGPEKMESVIWQIRQKYPDCAITISAGEYAKEVYRSWFEAGANRYLLRHETANPEHYRRLHPAKLTLENRIRCLYDLKDIGYQVGSGFMVGSPYQTEECLAEDLLFLRKLEPEMIGIGPFIPHHDTEFAAEPAGSLELTLFLTAVLRIMFPAALIPATTALGTIAPDGREQGILAGANVIMPNLSPETVREKYSLYDNKIGIHDTALQVRKALEESVAATGCRITVARGDYAGRTKGATR